jgi:O-methyltransferase involved in polyketide biosynthesis
VSAGVSMYLSKEANAVTLRQVAGPAAGTPFVSFFTPDEIVALTLKSGFKSASHVSGAELGGRYFSGRPDGLWPPAGEDLVVATT